MNQANDQVKKHYFKKRMQQADSNLHEGYSVNGPYSAYTHENTMSPENFHQLL